MALLAGAGDWVALGLALHRQHAPKYVAKTRPRGPREGTVGLHKLIAAETPLPPGFACKWGSRWFRRFRVSPCSASTRYIVRIDAR